MLQIQGFIMIPMLLSLTITSIITGEIISKTGKYKKLVIAEFIITGIGVVLLATMNANTPYYLLLVIFNCPWYWFRNGLYHIQCSSAECIYTARNRYCNSFHAIFQKYRYYCIRSNIWIHNEFHSR